MLKYFFLHNLSQKCFDEFLLKRTMKQSVFAIFGHYMGSKSLENTVFGLTACQNIGIVTYPPL